MKISILIIFIATSAVLFSMSSLQTANAIGHWLNRIKNKLSSDCSFNYHCDPSEICREGKCISACFRKTCNFNEGCQITYDHYATCQCLPGFNRDHNGICKRVFGPICRSNIDCDTSNICVNNKCIHACYNTICKANEACQITHHDSSCECLPNFIRSHVNQTCIPNPSRICSNNMDCSRTEICKHSICVSACYEQTCKMDHETCQVTNWNSFSCECSPGYIRAALNECVPICSNNDECNENEVCLTINHIPTCKCRDGYVPYDPNDLVSGNACVKNCNKNSDCDLAEKCEKNRCIDTCGFDTCNGNNTECIEEDHIARCQCPHGFIGDPNIGCVKSCKMDTDCVNYTDLCYKGNCTNACSVHPPCGDNAMCHARERVAQCFCYNGFIGDPNKKCEKKCSMDDDCDDSELCDSAVKQCVSACKNKVCVHNAECQAKNHHGTCS